MRVVYDPEVDILMVYLSDDRTRRAETKEVGPDVYMDVDSSGNPLQIEILSAKQRYAPEDLQAHDITTTLVSLSDASKRTGLAAGTLKNQVLAGRLKAQKVGKTWVTTEAWLRDYLLSRRYNAKDSAAI